MSKKVCGFDVPSVEFSEFVDIKATKNDLVQIALDLSVELASKNGKYTQKNQEIRELIFAAVEKTVDKPKAQKAVVKKEVDDFVWEGSEDKKPLKKGTPLHRMFEILQAGTTLESLELYLISNDDMRKSYSSFAATPESRRKSKLMGDLKYLNQRGYTVKKQGDLVLVGQ